MKTLAELSDVRIGEVMTRKVISVMAGDSVQDVAGIMLEHELSTIPVVNGAEKCIGILSRKDLTELFLQEDQELSRLLDTDRLSLEWFHRVTETSDARKVSELMNDNVARIDENAKLPDACREMARNKIHHLPVVDDREKVVGIVSSFDIVNAIANTSAE